MDEGGCESSEFQERLNRQLETPFSSGKYARVSVLIIYWEISDQQKEYEEEAENLGLMFRETFMFDVQYFRIPLSLSQVKLRRAVDDVLISVCEEDQKLGGGPGLLIIHYGGHGDKDDDIHKGEERRAVWRAYREDGPSVKWHEIQQTFRETPCDILLLLDCCYSAQAGRGRGKAEGRIELLAASGSREETPAPGDGSFTSVLIKTMKSLVEKQGSMTVVELHTKLSHRRVDLFTVPFHLRLRLGPTERSIKLEPLGINGPEAPGSQAWKSAVRVLIRMTEGLDEQRINEIAQWLRSDAPATIAGVRAETVILRTTNINKFIQEDLPDQTKLLVKTLDTPALEDIQIAWRNIQSLIDQYSKQHRGLPLPQKNPDATKEHARRFLEQMDKGNTRVLETLERSVLRSPQYSEPASLEQAIQDPSAERLGIKDQLILRHIVCSAEIYHSRNLEPAAESKIHEDVRILQEYKVYGENQSESEILAIRERVNLLAKLLESQKPDTFRSLKLCQLEHEPFDYRFVYRFEIPPKYRADHQNLYETIKRPWDKIRPSLGERFEMSFLIANAVQHWHSVGWVHQGICSHNILFFVRSDGKMDFSFPYLQGFDFSRPNAKPSLASYVDDINFDVYRHPDRQGPSRDGHLKIHDLYSLGVVLLEVGLWRRAIDIVRDQEKTLTLRKEQMYAALVDAAENRLAHYAGRQYQQAVCACLKGDFGIDLDDRQESKLMEMVKQKVLDKILRGHYVK